MGCALKKMSPDSSIIMENFRLKMLIIGPENSGKTSLLYKIK